MAQNKKIKLNLTEPSVFDIGFCVTFSCYDKSLISETESWHQTLPVTNFEISLIFSSFQLKCRFTRGE